MSEFETLNKRYEAQQDLINRLHAHENPGALGRARDNKAANGQREYKDGRNDKELVKSAEESINELLKKKGVEGSLTVDGKISSEEERVISSLRKNLNLPEVRKGSNLDLKLAVKLREHTLELKSSLYNRKTQAKLEAFGAEINGSIDRFEKHRNNSYKSDLQNFSFGEKIDLSKELSWDALNKANEAHVKQAEAYKAQIDDINKAGVAAKERSAEEAKKLTEDARKNDATIQLKQAKELENSIAEYSKSFPGVSFGRPLDTSGKSVITNEQVLRRYKEFLTLDPAAQRRQTGQNGSNGGGVASATEKTAEQSKSASNSPEPVAAAMPEPVRPIASAGNVADFDQVFTNRERAYISDLSKKGVLVEKSLDGNSYIFLEKSSRKALNLHADVPRDLSSLSTLEARFKRRDFLEDVAYELKDSRNTKTPTESKTHAEKEFSAIVKNRNRAEFKLSGTAPELASLNDNLKKYEDQNPGFKAYVDARNKVHIVRTSDNRDFSSANPLLVEPNNSDSLKSLYGRLLGAELKTERDKFMTPPAEAPKASGGPQKAPEPAAPAMPVAPKTVAAKPAPAKVERETKIKDREVPELGKDVKVKVNLVGLEAIKATVKEFKALNNIQPYVTYNKKGDTVTFSYSENGAVKSIVVPEKDFMDPEKVKQLNGKIAQLKGQSAL